MAMKGSMSNFFGVWVNDMVMVKVRVRICMQDTLSSYALGLAVVQPLGRVHARAKVSCIQGKVRIRVSRRLGF